MQYDSVNKALHQRFANGTQVIERERSSTPLIKSKARAFFQRASDHGVGHLFFFSQAGPFAAVAPWSMRVKKEGFTGLLSRLAGSFLQGDESVEERDAARHR